MAEEQKLSREELQKLEQIKQSNQQLMAEFGQIELQQRRLDERRESANEMYEEIKREERNFMNELQDKYEEGSIDLGRGVFVPSENSQQNVQRPQQKQPQDGQNEPKTAFDRR